MSGKLQFLSAKAFKEHLKSSEDPQGTFGVRKQFVPDEVTKAPVNDRSFNFTISTNAVDRDGDTINPEGFLTGAFEENPVVLFAHKSDQPPIGRATALQITKDSVKSTLEFTPEGMSEFNDMIFNMVDGGFLKATSVGFLPIEFEFPELDEDGNDENGVGRLWGIDFTKQELLEYSVVPVPSNAEALLVARSKGIQVDLLDEWFSEALRDWAAYKDCLLVPRSHVEQLAKAAHGESSEAVTTEETKRKRVKLRQDEDDDGEEIEVVTPEKSASGFFSDEGLDISINIRGARKAAEDDDADDAVDPDDKGSDDEDEDDEEKQTHPNASDGHEDDGQEVDEPNAAPYTTEGDDHPNANTDQEDDDEAINQPNAYRAVKIVGDGTPEGTFLVLSDTGEKIGAVASLSVKASADDLTRVTLELVAPELDLTLLTPKAAEGDEDGVGDTLAADKGTDEAEVDLDGDGFEVDDELAALLFVEEGGEKDADDAGDDPDAADEEEDDMKELAELVSAAVAETLPQVVQPLVQQRLAAIMGDADAALTH